ncbi:uncharacterized protein N7529_009507 [Penicillium soppii]|uniref:uncharacterized protein n=1 Tax=Penicillium soppii TaxID=69789 RepID=UPI0025492B30|nr:uncharacterized protein N7529_009507 [Penicillium soppii]KAJ5855563.1 hypothetical protein N7529_009507 [Penicillium soppii]
MSYTWVLAGTLPPGQWVLLPSVPPAASLLPPGNRLLPPGNGVLPPGNGTPGSRLEETVSSQLPTAISATKTDFEIKTAI